MPLKPSSKAWMMEHVNDPFVHLAKKHGYRARAAFKLKELNEKWHLIKKGMCVVDLGAAPGSWSQVLSQELNGTGKIIALDLLPILPVANVEILECDFSTVNGEKILKIALNNAAPDLILSDMAPNISGVQSVDQAKSVALAELALDFAQQFLKNDGVLVVKVFQGAELNAFLKNMQSVFQKVLQLKPKASRPRSPEVYLCGKGIKSR